MNNFDIGMVFEINNKLRQSESNNDINLCLAELTLFLRCEYFLFVIVNPTSMIKTDLFILDNYPKHWKEYYNNENLIKHDPVIDYCISNYSPIIWSMLKQNNNIKKEQNVIEQAKSVGLFSGFSFPIHTKNQGFGLISFANSKHAKSLNTICSNAYICVPLIIPELLDSYQRVNEGANKICTYLTQREKECLAWICEGKTTWEISKILGRSERTISFHLTNLQAKLGTNNRCQSVSKSILTGIINPFSSS